MMNWKKTIYIASKSSLGYDREGNSIILYAEPKMYRFNVQPINSNEDLMEFGIKASTMQKAIIPMKYKDVFKEGDVAWLDGVKPLNEAKNGDTANYRLYPPRNQNKVITIYFERITGK